MGSLDPCVGSGVCGDTPDGPIACPNGCSCKAGAEGWGYCFTSPSPYITNSGPLYDDGKIPQLTFVLMGCWALNEALSGKTSQKEIWEGLKKTLYISVAVIVLLWIIPAVIGYTGGSGPLQQRLATHIGANNPGMVQQLAAKISGPHPRRPRLSPAQRRHPFPHPDITFFCRPVGLY